LLLSLEVARRRVFDLVDDVLGAIDSFLLLLLLRSRSLAIISSLDFFARSSLTRLSSEKAGFAWELEPELERFLEGVVTLELEEDWLGMDRSS